MVNIDDFNRVTALSSIDSEKIKKIISSWRDFSLKFLSDSIDDGIQKYNESEELKTVTGREDECSGCGECIIFCPKKAYRLRKIVMDFRFQ